MARLISFFSFLLYFVILSPAKKIRLGKIDQAANDRLNQECDPSGSEDNPESENVPDERAKDEDVKYTVLIDIHKGESQCTGVLISRQHVLTAAHCFVRERECQAGPSAIRSGTQSSPKELPVQVLVGGLCSVLTSGSNCTEGYHMTKDKVAHIGVARRYYGSRCRSGDIAIVQLAEPLPEEQWRFDSVCLPSRTTKLNHEMSLAGFGYNPRRRRESDADTDVSYLKRVSLIRERFCDPSSNVGKDAFCVGMKTHEQLACRGDSGSGVMQKANSRKDYVMGVLSKGLDCDYIMLALEREPEIDDQQFRGSVVTDVRKYLDWICFHSGVCEKHINVEKMKKTRIVMIY